MQIIYKDKNAELTDQLKAICETEIEKIKKVISNPEKTSLFIKLKKIQTRATKVTMILITPQKTFKKTLSGWNFNICVKQITNNLIDKIHEDQKKQRSHKRKLFFWNQDR